MLAEHLMLRHKNKFFTQDRWSHQRAPTFIGLLVPIQLRQRRILATTDTITDEYLRLSRLWQITGAVATLLPLPILYFMIAKVH